MKLILEEKNKYVLRFDRGEEIMQELKRFCISRKIFAGFFTGLGANQEIELSWYDVDAKKYLNKSFKEKLEIISLSCCGNLRDYLGKIRQEQDSKAVFTRNRLEFNEIKC